MDDESFPLDGTWFLTLVICQIGQFSKRFGSFPVYHVWISEKNAKLTPCIRLLECGFQEVIYYECTSCQLPISSHHFWVGLLLHPPNSNSDDLKWATDKKSFIMNAPLVRCPFQVITIRWVQQQTHPKVMTGNGQLTRGAFIINDFLRNLHFSCYS